MGNVLCYALYHKKHSRMMMGFVFETSWSATYADAQRFFAMRETTRILIVVKTAHPKPPTVFVLAATRNYLIRKCAGVGHH